MEETYSRLYAMIRAAPGEGCLGMPLFARLGTVLSKEPLKIDVGGTVQEADRFYISERLLDGHSETVSIRGEASGTLNAAASCSYGSHDKLTIQSGELLLDDAVVIQRGLALKRGDLVLLLTEDDQTFYLLDKVVHL